MGTLANGFWHGLGTASFRAAELGSIGLLSFLCTLINTPAKPHLRCAFISPLVQTIEADLLIYCEGGKDKRSKNGMLANP